MTNMLIMAGFIGIIGLLLTIYFFLHYINVNKTLQWIGGITSGLFIGSLLSILILFLLWPPQINVSGILIFSVIAGITIMGRKNKVN